MGIEQLGEKEFARRSLWEATLFDENRRPLSWSTGLIKSINIPKLSFIVEDIYAGTSKGYLGWKLPDNLQLNIWETSDHQVEKYLDEWMTGKTGVFNPATGAFREQPDERYLYRDIAVKTFIYEFTESAPYRVKKKDVVSALALTINDGLREITGPLTIDQQEFVKGISEHAVDETGKIIYNRNYDSVLYVKEVVPAQKITHIERKQVIPVLDKITAAVAGIANQAVARVPASGLTRLVIPPVVIPPPLLRRPVPTGTPWAQMPGVRRRHIRLRDDLLHINRRHTKTAIEVMEGVVKKAEDILVEFASGEAANAKRWKSREKTTSLVTYSTAIEGYDIGVYDYESGGGVSYVVNLAVRDIKIEYPA